MTLDRSEVARLLALAACYDHRTVGEADVIAWQAALDGVTYSECEAAILAHAKTCRGRIMPADILVRIRDAKRSKAARLAALPTGVTDRARAAAAARRGIAAIYAQMGWTRDPHKTAALAQPCPVPHCWAQVGMACRGFGERRHGVHRQRLDSATAFSTAPGSGPQSSGRAATVSETA